MAEFKEISEKAIEIIKAFGEKAEPPVLARWCYKIMIIFLYTKTPDADEDVVRFLQSQDISAFDRIVRKALTEDEIDTLLMEFPAVVRYCYDCDFFHTPIVDEWGIIEELSWDLIDVCRNIMMMESNDYIGEILLPYASSLNFTDSLDKCSTDCFEPDQWAWVHNKIRFDAYNRKGRVLLGSSFKNLENKLYDRIFSCAIEQTESKTLANEYYNLATTCLKDGGVMCCILPGDFCYASEWYDFRKILSEKKGEYSATVILCPDMWVRPSGQNNNTCILFLFKNNIDKVVLMNAKNETFYRECLTDDGEEVFVFDYNKMLEKLNALDEEYVWVGSSDELTGQVNILPTRYLIQPYSPAPAEGETKVRLEDVIGIVALSHKTDTMDTPFFSHPVLDYETLSDNYILCGIPYENVPRRISEVSKMRNDISFPAEQTFYDKLVLTEGCLLASCFDGRKFRVGVALDFSDSKPVQLDGVIPFNMKSDIVNPDFLFKKILSDETIMAQVNALLWKNRSIDNVKRLDVEDFLQIEINVPSKEEQERLCKQDALHALDEVIDEIPKVKARAEEKANIDMRMKRHAIGQTISDLDNWWKALQRARRENEGAITDDTLVGKIKPTTVGEIFNGIGVALDRLQKQMEEFKLSNDAYEVKWFALTKFIEEYIDSHKNPDFEFEYDNTGQYLISNKDENGNEIEEEIVDGILIRKGDPIMYVKFAKEALTIIMGDIVSNANSHGFTDKNAKNIIRIKILIVWPHFAIEVSNNGKAIDKEISVEDIVTFGKSSKKGREHAGIGGYSIKRLMQEYGGDAEILSTPEEEFKVTYRLTFYNHCAGIPIDMKDQFLE